jgi:hypothetical protein
MQQFKISSEGIKEFKKATRTRTLLVLVLAGGVGFFMAGKNSPEKRLDLTTTLIAFPIFLSIFGLSSRKGYQRGVALLESYRLTIDENTIKREQHNTPAIAISKQAIKEISRGAKCIYIKPTDGSSPIMIPQSIENRETLENLLNEWSPVQTKAGFQYSFAYVMILMVITLGLMAVFFTSTAKGVSTATGALLLAGVIYMQVELKRNRNIDAKTRKGMAWVWVVGAAILFRIVMIWLGLGKQ